MLRYCSETEVVVWVECDRSCEVEILNHTAPTFEVEGHHFALVIVEDLEPGESTPYEVRLDGIKAWPPEDYEFPQPRIRTLPADSDVRLIFGSCRASGPHRPPHTFQRWWHPKGKGIDALNAYARRMLEQPEQSWPDALIMLGDQLYADEPPDAVKQVAGDRPVHPESPPGVLEDFEEFTVGYRYAWTRSLVRWLFSNVPTTMILDDHEINDMWRTSRRWLDGMRETSWYRDRVTGGLMAYWLFQHIGNLSPTELAADETFQRVSKGDDTAALRNYAIRAEAEDGLTRFSFRLDLGPARLLAIDSRAGRVLDEGERRIVGDEEWGWILDQAADHGEHVILASSLPFLLPYAMHHMEAWSEAVDAGAWGDRFRLLGEKVRGAANLDHWAAFQRSFAELENLVIDIATGTHGEAPRSLIMLGGDVHHCFVSEVELPEGLPPTPTKIRHVVCSGLRKELELKERLVLAFGHTRLAARLARRLAESANANRPRLRWRQVSDSHFRNQIGTLEIRRDRVDLRLERARGLWGSPRLETVHESRLV